MEAFLLILVSTISGVIFGMGLGEETCKKQQETEQKIEKPENPLDSAK